MPAHCSTTKLSSRSYFVVMLDLGKRGFEAVVHPEDTRRDIVARIVSGEIKHVAFIHYIDGLYVDDVTEDIFDEAEQIVLHTAADCLR